MVGKSEGGAAPWEVSRGKRTRTHFVRSHFLSSQFFFCIDQLLTTTLYKLFFLLPFLQTTYVHCNQAKGSFRGRKRKGRKQAPGKIVDESIYKAPSVRQPNVERATTPRCFFSVCVESITCTQKSSLSTAAALSESNKRSSYNSWCGMLSHVLTIPPLSFRMVSNV